MGEGYEYQQRRSRVRGSDNLHLQKLPPAERLQPAAVLNGDAQVREGQVVEQVARAEVRDGRV